MDTSKKVVVSVVCCLISLVLLRLSHLPRLSMEGESTGCRLNPVLATLDTTIVLQRLPMPMWYKNWENVKYISSADILISKPATHAHLHDKACLICFLVATTLNPSAFGVTHYSTGKKLCMYEIYDRPEGNEVAWEFWCLVKMTD